jgi:D-alanyl-D-alanine carboxypeptidase (penicillin-binding protein 5/6)
MRTIRIVVAAVALAGLLAPAAASQTPAPSPTPKPGGVPSVQSAGAILVNASDDGQILFTRQATLQRAPASLTKVVTALVALDEFDVDDVVKTNSLVLQTHGSDLGLEPGMHITVRELLWALLLKSANDAGMALAAHHRAGYEHFIALMNQKARSLGAYDSQFRNPHGLDQVGHYSSARDMAIFARELLRDPLLASIVDAEEHTMTWKNEPRTYGTHNKLIRQEPSVIGVKTGFTNNAGHCLISAATTPAGTLITVVMGSPNHYAETLSMFEYGKTVSLREAAGGGSVEGFGQLPAPPAPPDTTLAAAPVDRNDPRDDLRWALLMLTLALATAATLLWTRRHPAGATNVDAWLARLADEPRRRPS